MPNFRTYVRLSREIIRAKKNSVNRFSQKTPAVGNSRGCAGQVAHRAFFFPASRTPAHLRRASRAPCLCLHLSRARPRLVPCACPTPGFCFPRQGKSPRLRRAHLRWAIRAPAPGKSRTVSFSSPRLARPRACGGQFAHLVCSFAQPRTHAVFSRCGPFAGLLFSRAGKKLRRIPNAQKRPKSWSFAPWLFGRFLYLPAVCGPKGRLSRPAAREKGRSAAGRRHGVQRGSGLACRLGRR